MGVGIIDIEVTLLFLDLNSLVGIQLSVSGSSTKLGLLSHETDEKIETQEKEMTCLGSLVAELAWEPIGIQRTHFFYGPRKALAS